MKKAGIRSIENKCGKRALERGRRTRDLMDRLGKGCSPDRKKRLTDIFITSSRYEYLFWEMAEKLEQWSA